MIIRHMRNFIIGKIELILSMLTKLQVNIDQIYLNRKKFMRKHLRIKIQIKKDFLKLYTFKYRKIKDNTNKCLITLVLDFPTHLSENYAAYINYPFEPNVNNQEHFEHFYNIYMHENPIHYMIALFSLCFKEKSQFFSEK